MKLLFSLISTIAVVVSGSSLRASTTRLEQLETALAKAEASVAESVASFESQMKVHHQEAVAKIPAGLAYISAMMALNEAEMNGLDPIESLDRALELTQQMERFVQYRMQILQTIQQANDMVNQRTQEFMDKVEREKAVMVQPVLAEIQLLKQSSEEKTSSA